MLSKVSSRDQVVCTFLEVERSLRKENDGSLLSRRVADLMIISWQELFRDRRICTLTFPMCYLAMSL